MGKNYPAVIPGVVKESVVYDPETQSNMFMTAEGLDRITGYNEYAYQAKNNTPLSYAKTKVLYSALYDTNLFRSIDDALDTTTHGETYIRARGMHATSVGLSLLFGLIALLSSALVVKRLVEADRKQMGVLKAHGYTALETALPFTTFAILSSLIGSVAGWIIGCYWRASLPWVGGQNPSSPAFKQKRLPNGKALFLAGTGLALRSQTSCLLPPGRGFALSGPSMAPFPPLGRRAKPFESCI